MSAPKQILNLVARFEEHREVYLSGNYNETQLRKEFLDPFFEALGWDVGNKQGYDEQYKDVVYEETIRAGAPDYSFRIGGFFFTPSFQGSNPKSFRSRFFLPYEA